MNIPTIQLAEWEKDQSARAKETLQGKTRTYTDAQILYVVQEYKTWSTGKQRVKITGFMHYLRKQWQTTDWLESTPSRQTVTDMLLANGCRRPKSNQTLQHKGFYPKIKRFAPHVQSVMDGKQITVHYHGDAYDFLLEMSKDMATDAITSTAIGKTESSALVKEAFATHCANYRAPVATLLDNGKGNCKAAIDLGTAGTLFIHAFPKRPQTKGQIEGEFGLFERNVSNIVIEGDTSEQQALSVVKQIVMLYCKLRNQTPRCSNCPFTPAKLMKANLDAVSEDQYYSILKAEQDRQEEFKAQRLKMDQKRHDLIDSIVKSNGLRGDVVVFKRCSRWIELSTLRRTEAEYAKMKARDNFDLSKQTVNYFYGIARNLQHKKDELIKQNRAKYRYGLELEMKRKRENVTSELEQKKDKENIQNNPYVLIVRALNYWASLPHELKAKTKLHTHWIDQAINILKNKKSMKRKSDLLKIEQAVLAMTDLSRDERYKWIDYVKNKL